MNIHASKRMLVVGAVLGAVGVFAIGFFVALGVRAVVAGPDSGPAAAPPNPGHTYEQIELPAGTWPGLDADTLDGLNSDEIQDADDYVSTAGTLSRLGFSTAAVDSTGEVTTFYEYTSVTVGADGLPLISYYHGSGRNLKVVHCGNAACSAGNTITNVDSTSALVGRSSSVTVGADGLPVISYFDDWNDHLKVAHCGNAACTAGNTITTVDSAGQVGMYTSVTVGADGLPLISYHDLDNADLKVAHCGNAACTAGNTITTVDTAPGDFTSVTVGVDGLPLISYFTGSDLKVAHCGNAACTAGNTITTVDSGGTVGLYTSVTVGTDGLPVISYYDQTNHDLKVAHCGNAACSAGNTITTVDTAGHNHTAVTVGADGLPLISYYGNGNLKVAHCGNAACTAGNTIATVDSTGDVGWYTSVTVGADGLPVLSYYDATNGDLKVAHCSNRFCVPYHRPR